MPTTIGRNRRQYVLNVRAEYTDCRKYDPVTDKWNRCDEEEAWTVLEAEENKSARLIESDDKSVYTITFRRTVYELRKPRR